MEATMELGNMAFGNSRGEWPMPRHAGFEEELLRLFDAYAPNRNDNWREYGVEFENNTFWVSPYFWGDCTCDDEHEADCPCLRDNFYYKPTGFGIQWYKYPLRDSYASEEIVLEKFRQIITRCIESVAQLNDGRE